MMTALWMSFLRTRTRMRVDRIGQAHIFIGVVPMDYRHVTKPLSLAAEAWAVQWLMSIKMDALTCFLRIWMTTQSLSSSAEATVLHRRRNRFSKSMVSQYFPLLQI